MTPDAALSLKTRLRADLRTAMKDGRSAQARLLRALVAAIDNAEAPPIASGASPQHRFGDGSAEVERLLLGPDAVQTILLAEIAEREGAAQEMEQRGQADRASVLRAEAEIVRAYLPLADGITG